MNNKIVHASESRLYTEEEVVESHEPQRQNAEKIIKSLKIPPLPLALISLKQELSNEHAENKTINDIIDNELTVAAGVIKTINSPFFELENKIENIQRAVTVFGMANVVNIVNCFALKEALRELDYPEIDGYLDMADDIALIAACLAKDLAGMDPDAAYMLGFFHDVGMPLLLQKFDNYTHVLQYACSSVGESQTDVEDYNLNINHAVVGYYVCKTWGIPEQISLAILNHHNIEEILMSESGKYTSELKSSVALLAMAVYLAYAYYGKAERTHWEEESSLVLSYLNLNEPEFELIKSTIFERLGE